MSVRGIAYRWFMRFIHRHGFHYAPADPHLREYHPGKPGHGIDSVAVTRHRHWCQWCGLRGGTIEIHLDKRDQSGGTT